MVSDKSILTIIQKVVIRWKMFYLYSVILLLLSVLPINSTGTAINHIFVVNIRLDYLLHCLVYIPMVYLTWIDKEINSTLTGKAFGWLVVLLLFAAATEGLQYFLPYRAFNINDLLANCLGILVGLGFILIFERVKN